MPLPNTRVIHPLWRERHTPTVLGTMTARLRLSKPGRLGTHDPVSGKTPTLPPASYYEGPGRLQNLGGANPADSPAERKVTTAPYLVAVPVDLAAAATAVVELIGEVPEEGDLVDVLAADDPLLVGVRLYVTEIPTASIVLQRNLGADSRQPTTPRG